MFDLVKEKEYLSDDKDAVSLSLNPKQIANLLSRTKEKLEGKAAISLESLEIFVSQIWQYQKIQTKVLLLIMMSQPIKNRHSTFE